MRKLFILLILTTAMATISCRDNGRQDGNPLLTGWTTPYGIPPFDKILPEHYVPAITEAMAIHKEEIDRIAGNDEPATFDNTILALDRAGELYGRLTTLLGLISSADNTAEIREVRQELTPLMTAHSGDIYLNDRLFERVRAVYDTRNDSGLDPLQVRLTEKTYKSFLRSGAHLGEEDKATLRQIDEQLSMAQLRFNSNLLEADRKFRMVVDTADVEGLPQAIKDAAMDAAAAIGEKGRYAFSTGKASMIPFLTNSPRSDLRQTLYQAYLDRCNYGDETDNRETINEIVRLRDRKARLLGFDTFADYTLDDRMAPSAAAVYGLLDGLWGPSLEQAKRELARMQELKESEDPGPFLKSDWWYYAEKVRKADYSLDEETLKNYFPLSAVQTGVFELCNKLYGISFKPINNVPLYHKDCAAFEVWDEDNTHLGILITDYIAREGYKNPGAWCGSYRSRTYTEDGRLDPIVTVVCNYPAPAGNRPTLLTLDQTTTLFHEFGHAIHALFTDVPYKGLQRVERDFVELPSQIMENWALEPDMLRRYALHYSSNAVIPDQLIEKIQQTATFNQGFILTELVAASLSDMDIHTIPGFESVDINEFEVDMLNVRRGLIDEIAPRYRYPYFSHIFSGGYAAGYYSYLWAEVLDKDAYEAFLESGDLYDKKIARSFRDNILSKGGSEDGMEMYRNFRGAEPASEPLLYARGLAERPPRPVDDFPFDPGFEEEEVTEGGESEAPVVEPAPENESAGSPRRTRPGRMTEKEETPVLEVVDTPQAEV
ncbi:MAG: M3 family metallopeptidase [Alistipes sp.]|nr:M3 family metallopeptidase [Alistipes sp.]